MEDDSKSSLFLGDLPFVSTEDDVRRAFEPYGLVLAVRIKRGKSKKNLSYGFIDFSTMEEAINAMHAMDGANFLGKELK